MFQRHRRKQHKQMYLCLIFLLVNTVVLDQSTPNSFYPYVTPIGTVAWAFTFLWDKLCRNSSKGPGKRGHIVADTNVSLFARARNICCGHKFCVRDTKSVSDFVQKHFVSATNVSQFAQHGNNVA